MDVIPCINDLKIEIDILKDVKKDKDCNNAKIDKMIKEKTELLEKCKDNLKKFSYNSIEYRLYLNLLNGMSPTKAVEKISLENEISQTTPTALNTIWKKYKKLKNLIKE